jgi:glycosyltransferase involved in cell wall biosynthesis
LKLVAFLNSYTEGISGGDVRFIEIAKRFARKNVEIWVVTSKLGKEVCEEHGLKVKYVLTTFEDKINNVIYTYLRRIICAIFLKLEIENNAILWSTSDFLPDVLPAFLFKRRNSRIIWIASIYHLIPDPFKRPGHLKLSNVLSYVGQQVSLLMIRRRADLIQTETLFLKNKLIKEYKIPPERIIAIQSGINTKVIDEASPNNKKKIYDACFLARLHPSKGIFDLIKAWKYVCEHKKDAKLAIAGSGSIEIFNELKSIVKSLGLESNVSILGFLSEEDKYKLLSSSKLYVLPSYEEGIPITFYEAMYCGLPVVTYYLPTYGEIRSYIVSVPLGDVKKLAEEIIRLLGDEDSARKLAEKGREFAEERTWDKVAECIISQLEKLV